MATELADPRPAPPTAGPSPLSAFIALVGFSFRRHWRLPRWAVYLAKFLGVLPWCLLASLGGFAALCAAGGEYGARALQTYWPAAVAGTVGFAALFHLVGAVFRRPAVVGLVYAFFFET